jgi:integrase
MVRLLSNPAPQPSSGNGIVLVEPSREPLGGIQMARRRAQQKGYVHKQGNAWYLAFRQDALDADGKIVRVRRNQKIAEAKEVSKREAQRLAREILNRVDDQAQRPMSLVTVRDFIETRFKADVIWALKHAGQLHYSYILDKHVLPAMGDVRLRDVSSDHVQALVRKKYEAGYAVQTVVHIRNAISAVFNHAKLKRAYWGDNPVQGVRMPEMQHKETHALSFSVGNELLSRLPSPAREMVLLSMTTSLNVAEMLGLSWKRVNLTDETVVVGSEGLQPRSLVVRENCYRGKFGTVKAKSRRRTVPLSTTTVKALQGLRSGSEFNEPDDLVFAARKGTPLNEMTLLRRVIKPIAVKLGMPWLSWHVFRHTHATLGEQIGMTLSDRQAQMGHGDVRMTMHYTHSDLERRRAGIEAMSERLTVSLSEAGIDRF